MGKEDQPARDREQESKPATRANDIGKEGHESGGNQRTQGGRADQQRETDVDRGSRCCGSRAEPKQGAETCSETLSSPKFKLNGPNVAGHYRCHNQRRNRHTVGDVCANPGGREALGDVGNGNSDSGLAAKQPAHIPGTGCVGPLLPDVAASDKTDKIVRSGEAAQGIGNSDPCKKEQDLARHYGPKIVANQRPSQDRPCEIALRQSCGVRPGPILLQK